MNSSWPQERNWHSNRRILLVHIEKKLFSAHRNRIKLCDAVAHKNPDTHIRLRYVFLKHTTLRDALAHQIPDKLIRLRYLFRKHTTLCDAVAHHSPVSMIELPKYTALRLHTPAHVLSNWCFRYRKTLTLCNSQVRQHSYHRRHFPPQCCVALNTILFYICRTRKLHETLQFSWSAVII